MLSVVTIDPGVTTGYCIASIFAHKKTTLVVGEREMSCLELFSWLESREPDVIICEDFTYRPGMLPGLEMYSRNLIGVINLYAELADSAFTWAEWRQPQVVMQQPKEKDGFFKSKERLKDMGVWASGKTHGRDATRHFLQWHNFKGGYQHNNKLGYELVVP